MASSPATRTLKYFRDLGYSAQVVERWNPYARVRVDLFGFIDVVAIKDGEIIGVQTTSKGNITTRIKKILDIPEAKVWLRSGGKIIVQGWGKQGAKGKRKLWKEESREIFLNDFQP